MSGLRVHLIGQPTMVRSNGALCRFRSRKSWALLTYLLLTGRPQTRAHLASLLFAEANDPSRALRWSLAEIRRALGSEGSIGGNPVRVQLGAGATVDVDVIARQSWQQAVELPALGADLLDGMSIQRAPAFESWLLCEQRAVQGATEAIFHEAALGWLSRGKYQRALKYAVRAAAMDPLDESHHALVIRLYRLAGDPNAARQQLRLCTELLDQELGSIPGPAVHAAMRETPDPDSLADSDTVAALVEAGSAAVSAGSAAAGIATLRSAVALADQSGPEGLCSRARISLADALIHATGGLDEAGLEMLHEAEEIATRGADRASLAQVWAELGYVDFLRARYSRAAHWLEGSLQCASDSPALVARATTYLGAVASDRGDYPAATTLIAHAIELARAAREPRIQAYALSVAGRTALLREDFTAAEKCLDESIRLADADHWLAFLPWPQALRGEVTLAQGDTDQAEAVLRQAFARACQLADPCWEGAAGRALGLLAATRGEADAAVARLTDARRRCTRVSDPYVWMEASILDALCSFGVRHHHPGTERWVDELHRLASRAGMREFVVRALLYATALGHPGARDAAALIAADIENPALDRLVTVECRAGR